MLWEMQSSGEAPMHNKKLTNAARGEKMKAYAISLGVAFVLFGIAQAFDSVIAGWFAGIIWYALDDAIKEHYAKV